MSSCAFEELVSRVAALLSEGHRQQDIDDLLELLSSAYRAEVLASAQDIMSKPVSAGEESPAARCP